MSKEQCVFPNKPPAKRKPQKQWALIDSNGLKQWDLSSARYDDAVEEALCDLGYEVVEKSKCPD